MRGATGSGILRIIRRKTEAPAVGDGLVSKPAGVHLKTKLDGMAMIIPLFTQAGEIQQGKTVTDADIARVFADWVEPAPAERAAAAGSSR